LLPAAAIQALTRAHAEAGAAVALLEWKWTTPPVMAGCPRCERNVTAIVEEADADEAVRAVVEINSGTYCFDLAWLIDHRPCAPE
jgi:bifunctional UDP-N-acetylglucosamine pyrophosphorylase/glucosamine-1-phosphate N-acetyltransferase